LERRLGYTFRDPALLERALTHRSFAHERGSPADLSQDYESFEFLGDSLIGFLISEYLVRNDSGRTEGELSKTKAVLVSTRHLASISKRLGLGSFMKLGHGEEKSGGRSKKSLLADLFESVVAAVYLDGGIDPARRLVFSSYEPLLESLKDESMDFRDRKSLLQERLHAAGLAGPKYRVISEQGPAHEKSFTVEVVSQGKPLATGSGLSKKEAEQQAAGKALEELTS